MAASLTSSRRARLLKKRPGEGVGLSGFQDFGVPEVRFQGFGCKAGSWVLFWGLCRVWKNCVLLRVADSFNFKHVDSQSTWIDRLASDSYQQGSFVCKRSENKVRHILSSCSVLLFCLLIAVEGHVSCWLYFFKT